MRNKIIVMFLIGFSSSIFSQEFFEFDVPINAEICTEDAISFESMEYLASKGKFIPNNSKIILSGRSEKKFIQENKLNYWYLVEIGNKSVFVFGSHIMVRHTKYSTGYYKFIPKLIDSNSSFDFMIMQIVKVCNDKSALIMYKYDPKSQGYYYIDEFNNRRVENSSSLRFASMTLEWERNENYANLWYNAGPNPYDLEIISSDEISNLNIDYSRRNLTSYKDISKALYEDQNYIELINADRINSGIQKDWLFSLFEVAIKYDRLDGLEALIQKFPQNENYVFEKSLLFSIYKKNEKASRILLDNNIDVNYIHDGRHYKESIYIQALSSNYSNEFIYDLLDLGYDTSKQLSWEMKVANDEQAYTKTNALGYAILFNRIDIAKKIFKNNNYKDFNTASTERIKIQGSKTKIETSISDYIQQHGIAIDVQ